MRLTHSFAVRGGIDEVYAALTDLTKVARCIRDARFEVVSREELGGELPLRLAVLPIDFRGSTRLAETDPEAHTATLEARGEQQRGDGSIEATIEAKLFARGKATRVKVDTNMTLRGAPAQVPRGVFEKLGERRLAEFGQCMSAQLAGELDAPPADELTERDGQLARAIDELDVDLLDTIAAFAGRDVRRLLRAGRVVRRLVEVADRVRSEAGPEPATSPPGPSGGAAAPVSIDTDVARRAAPAAIAALLVALLFWWRFR